MTTRGYCSTCRATVGRNHASSAVHRRAVIKSERIPDIVGGEEQAARASLARSLRPYSGTDEENDAAMRRLDGHQPAWMDELPPVPESDDPEYRAPVRPTRSLRPGPCPRCGRSDFRTEAGRAWHIASVPACRSYVRPDRHDYAMMPA